MLCFGREGSVERQGFLESDSPQNPIPALPFISWVRLGKLANHPEFSHNKVRVLLL